jgi:hypothetical protein
MKYEVYTEIEVTDDFDIFDFISTGRNGDILKRVAFTKTEMDGVYNLVLGDVHEGNEIDDYAITDNGDRNKVLATVASIVEAYTRRFPSGEVLQREHDYTASRWAFTLMNYLVCTRSEPICMEM